MTKEEMVRRLPDAPMVDMHDWIIDTYGYAELGGEACIFRREAVEVGPAIGMIMDDAAWAARDAATSRHWGALCSCTACESDFYAGWIPGGGIAMVQGEDGLFYDGWCDYKKDDAAFAIMEGDGFACPCCGADVTLVRAGNIKTGRTYQLQTVSIEVIDGIAVLLYWMTRRRIEPEGVAWCETRPRDAVALLSDGRFWKFTRAQARGMFGETLGDTWSICSNVRDPQQLRYYDHGSANSQKMGAAIWKHMPDLAGTTAEKTGLADYIAAGGGWPLVYLKTWRYHPAIENLVKAGWTSMLESWIEHKIAIHAQYHHDTSIVDFEWIDWESARPHEMLGMTRAEVRCGARWRWTFDDAMLWSDLSATGHIKSASDYQRMLEIYGRNSILEIDELIGDGWDIDHYRADRYFNAQAERSEGGLTAKDACRLWIDYIKMADKILHGELDAALLWPRDVYAAHERYCEIQRARAADDYAIAFAEVLKKCAALEWTDGDLCIRLPRDNGDLVAEGKTLHHCVGGYGKKHAGGTDLIFFVRRYRRPERSYYTLNESISDYRPHRIQLHGYGNEWHGGAKRGRHKIPKKVQNFVARWETEILKPWCMAQLADEAARKKTRRRSA